MLNVYSISLGCPKNRVDSERLLGSLGVPVRPVKHLKSAHLVFVNTCAFIQPAVQESVHTILDLAADIQNAAVKNAVGQKPLLVVAGCLPGRYGSLELAKELPEVDLWLDMASMPQWAELVRNAILKNVKSRGAAALAGSTAKAGRLLSTGPSYAWLKVSEGCGQNCSFCTIPKIRGKVRSLSADFLRDEAAALVQKGVKELVLVAQDLTSWGRDLSGKPSLENLLEALLPLQGIERIRLMYLYPAGLTDSLLSFVQAAGTPLLPYFDVPLQHAHPDVLTRMGRPFAQSPLKVVERIRKYLPDAALRTSLITGFPGETEEHFDALYRFVEDTRFHNLGVFAYQPEDGTPAASMPEQLPENVKEERRAAIMELQSEISREILAGYLAQELDVLVDSIHPEWPGLYVGRAWFQAPEVDGVTYVSAEHANIGDILKADISESFEYDLNALA